MQKLLRYKWLIIAIFTGLMVLSVAAVPLVGVNYDVLGYLPQNSPSTLAIDRIQEVFGISVETDTRVMVQASSIPQALEYKAALSQIGGVDSVQWLDDKVALNRPDSFIDPDTMSAYFSNGYALFTLVFTDGMTDDALIAAVNEIHDAVGSDAHIAGGDAGELARKNKGNATTTQMILLLIPLVLGIMLLATSSWLEPVLFLAVIAISILINFGTNIFQGEISFVSQTTTAALQLAVSMDYSIFLLHSFKQKRDQGLAPAEAMDAARKQTLPSIIASAATTLCGFLALTLMRFGIGADLGYVLAKGVLISLLTVVFLLPILTMLIYKPLEKCSHRSFLPAFTGFARFVLKAGTPIIILVVLITIPVYLGQSNNSFIYMSGEQVGSDEYVVAQEFGRAEQLALIVPSGDTFSEKAMADELMALPQMTDSASYVTTVGMEIPLESLPRATRDMLSKGGYSSMLLTVNAQQDTKEGFEVVQSVRNIANAYYGDTYYLAGTLASLFDMRDVVNSDMSITALAAILAIAVIILITFKSPLIVILLVGTIEISIWINLSIPYFTGTQLTFLGYTIINAIQLGATVDYAILFFSRYKEKRQTMGRTEATKVALSETTGSILTSAAILFGVGMIITSLSSEAMVVELGMLIGRGAVLSASMVLLFLPNIVRLFDTPIRKTTYKSNFLLEVKK